MDPLSDLLSLLKPRSYTSGGVGIAAHTGIRWPQHEGIKCYAMVSGQCWLQVDGIAEPVLLNAGECYLMPPGPAFTLSTDRAAPAIDFSEILAARKAGTVHPASNPQAGQNGGCYLVGGHFLLEGHAADMLLSSLPPIVHIAKEADKAAMRWSLERMAEEVRDPQPGGTLIAQQLAYMMLVQALRLHLAERGSVGWLFALADRQLSAALSCMHEAPGHAWTLQKLAQHIGMSRSTFALRFKETVGTTPMEYLTRWRMLLACERLGQAHSSIPRIAAELGYESESAFGKAFKRVMGCSPRQHSRRLATAL